jgi:predicted nucleic acid-binding protein
MSITDEFVLDNSVTMSWAFPDEANPYAQDVLTTLPGASAVVPSIWPLEAANVLLVGERRGRISRADSTSFVAILDSLSIGVDGETSERALKDTLDLARAQGLSVYDAAYLELAMRRGLPLATLDDKLKAAALAVGVAIYSV